MRSSAASPASGERRTSASQRRRPARPEPAHDDYTRPMPRERRRPEPLDRRELADVARFRLALRRFEVRTSTAVKRCGLTPQRYLLLLAVENGNQHGEEVTVSSLSRELEMPQTTVSDLVARGIAIGLLERTAARGGRSSNLALSAEGRRLLTEAVGELRADRSELRRVLGDLS